MRVPSLAALNEWAKKSSTARSPNGSSSRFLPYVRPGKAIASRSTARPTSEALLRRPSDEVEGGHSMAEEEPEANVRAIVFLVSSRSMTSTFNRRQCRDRQGKRPHWIRIPGGQSADRERRLSQLTTCLFSDGVKVQRKTAGETLKRTASAFTWRVFSSRCHSRWRTRRSARQAPRPDQLA